MFSLNENDLAAIQQHCLEMGEMLRGAQAHLAHSGGEIYEKFKKDDKGLYSEDVIEAFRIMIEGTLPEKNELILHDKENAINLAKEFFNDSPKFNEEYIRMKGYSYFLLYTGMRFYRAFSNKIDIDIKSIFEMDRKMIKLCYWTRATIECLPGTYIDFKRKINKESADKKRIDLNWANVISLLKNLANDEPEREFSSNGIATKMVSIAGVTSKTANLWLKDRLGKHIKPRMKYKAERWLNICRECSTSVANVE